MRADGLMSRKSWPAAVLGYVRAEFRRRFGLQWLNPIDFNNIYALLMRGR